MLTRALIVLLLVLNLGVGAWWATRPPPPVAAVAPPPPGVARLQLLDEAPKGNAAPAAASPAASGPGPKPAPPAECASFGPFATAAAADQAQQRLRALGLQVTAREAFAEPARGWKVWLPPLASPPEAEAAAARVVAAGFQDYYIVHDGPEANSLALGRFTSETSARQHAAALVAAGFPARAEPIGTGPASHWLDVAAGEGFDAGQVQAQARAPGRRALACASLR